MNGETQNEQAEERSKYLNAAINIGKDFAMANYSQFQSDLGISGQGAISQGIDQGISWAMGTVTKMIGGAMGGQAGGNSIVNNVDDAVAAYDYKDRKKSKQYVGRSSS